MATQKEMRAIREEIIGLVQELDFEGYEFEGIITDGLLFQHQALETFVVLKPIVKKEGFDFEDALLEYQEKQQARLDKEKEKLEKAIVREEKAKAKLEEIEEEEKEE